jgi:hypothetical protein
MNSVNPIKAVIMAGIFGVLVFVVCLAGANLAHAGDNAGRVAAYNQAAYQCKHVKAESARDKCIMQAMKEQGQ